MIRGPGEVLRKQGVKKMSLQQREAVLSELNDVKEQLKGGHDPKEGTASRPDRIQDKAVMVGRQKYLEELLNHDDDLTPNEAERAKIDKRLKELIPLIKKDMLSEREEKLKPTKAQDFEKAVQKQLHATRPEAHKLREEYQNLMRRLEPNDPNAGYIGDLRA